MTLGVFTSFVGKVALLDTSDIVNLSIDCARSKTLLLSSDRSLQIGCVDVCVLVCIYLCMHAYMCVFFVRMYAYPCIAICMHALVFVCGILYVFICVV